ncbi:MAG: pitrilysin family protein [Synechococcales bacterium]|nr:pitrilysin family protein [Synechococcales bacterium]
MTSTSVTSTAVNPTAVNPTAVNDTVAIQSIALSQNRLVHRSQLPNGIVILVTENPAADIISTRLFLRGGQRVESSAKAGLVHLVAAVLTKGTATKTSMQLAEQVESVGASLGIDAAPDYFLISLKTVSDDFLAILTLAAEMLRSPSFPEAEFELERRLTLQALRTQQEQPFTVAMDYLRRAFYGHHPYADGGLGTAETLISLTREDLVTYHKTWFRPDNLIISLAGRVEAAQVITQIAGVLGDWQAPSTPLPTVQTPEVVLDPQQILIPQDTQQSIVMVGYLAPAIAPNLKSIQDFAALKLLNTYLGNGLSSRLFVELREKQGLAYEVSTFYPTRLDPSHFVAYMGTAPENTAIALEGLQTELERLKDQPLSETELQTTQRKLLGQYALGKQTNAQIAQIFGWYELLGAGVEFDLQFQETIAALSSSEIQATAQRHFDQSYYSILGPADFIQLDEDDEI